MRTLLSAITAFFVTIYGATLVIVARLFRRPVLEGGIYERAMRNWAQAIIKVAGVTVVHHHADRIPRGGAVLICNHVSWFDVFALAATVPRCTFVAKLELRSIPLFGWGAESAGVVFIDRDNRKSAFESYRFASEAVRAGRRITVFPEGTRGDEYALRSFKKGPFVLAITANAPIVPTVVYGAREVMGRTSWRIRPGTIHLHFCEPIETANCDYEDRHEVMHEAYARMERVLADEYGVKAPL